MNDCIAEINSIAQLLLYRWRHIDIKRPLIFSELLNNKKCVTTYYVLLIEGGMWGKGEVLDCDQSTKNSELGQRPPHCGTYIYGLWCDSICIHFRKIGTMDSFILCSSEQPHFFAGFSVLAIRPPVPVSPVSCGGSAEDFWGAAFCQHSRCATFSHYKMYRSNVHQFWSVCVCVGVCRSARICFHKVNEPAIEINAGSN